MGFTDTFGGSTIYPSDTTYLALSFSADIQLSWPVEQQIGGDLVVAKIMDLNASAPGLSVILPDARNATSGFTALFNNVGAESVTIRNALGGVIAMVSPGSAWQLYMTSNATESGSWRTFQYGASVSVVDAAALVGNGLTNVGTALALNYDVTDVAASPLALDVDARARLFNWTGGTASFTLPNATTLGDGWFTMIRNSGGGDITITPSAGTIDGSTDTTVAPGGSIIVVSDGFNYLTLISQSGGAGGFNLLSINVAGGGDYALSGVQLNQTGYRLIGVLTANRNIIVPGTLAEYWIDNQTTGAYTLTVKTAAGTGFAVPQGTRAILYCDGVDVVEANSSSSISFPLSVAQGGTGANSQAGAQANLNVPPTTRTISAGTGLTGGGDLSANRTLSLANTAVTPGSYTFSSITVDAQGRIIAAASGSPTLANALTINNGGAGAASGATFNGSAAVTISYNTVGAPSAAGAGASGTWSISINGNAATATLATHATSSGVPQQATGLINGQLYIVNAGFTINSGNMVGGNTYSVLNSSGTPIILARGGGVDLILGGDGTIQDIVVAPYGVCTLICTTTNVAICVGNVS